MSTYRITTEIEHNPGDMAEPAYAALVMYANGQRINHQNFPTNHPTGAEISAARQSLAFNLYFNPHYSIYQNALYYLAFPYGE